MMKRRGFTIVELLMVIAIISVLITISVSAISGAVKRSRDQKASALCTLVEQGIATYYTQKGAWPVEPGNKDSDEDNYEFTGEEVRKIVKTIVEQTKENNPMMDVSGLVVSTFSGESGQRGPGMDFISAIHGTKQHPKKMKLSQMYFGYINSNGYFRRFRMVYSPMADKITVSKLD